MGETCHNHPEFSSLTGCKLNDVEHGKVSIFVAKRMSFAKRIQGLGDKKPREAGDMEVE